MHRWDATCLGRWSPAGTMPLAVAPSAEDKSAGHSLSQRALTSCHHSPTTAPVTQTLWDFCSQRERVTESVLGSLSLLFVDSKMDYVARLKLLWGPLCGWSKELGCVAKMLLLSLLLSLSLCTLFTRHENVLKHCSKNKGGSRVGRTDSESESLPWLSVAFWKQLMTLLCSTAAWVWAADSVYCCCVSQAGSRTARELSWHYRT